ncbi:hypothetical protein VNO78_16680 [Psophocarpus tetragonolobus]|uniref:Uncharacterized protein n=1 Tax=Psophocarpus tetragonolobus TaxID=3891 RepID=A0AAN9SGZ9_PSOTE
MVLFTQQRLLSDLESLAPHEHESMREAAETTFALLNVLGVDYKQFSDNVLDYVNFVASMAEADKSMEDSLTMEELNKLFEEDKMRFAQLQDNYVKTETLLEASNRHRQLLCAQIEAHLDDLKRNISETEITLKEKADQTEVAWKQGERQANQISAKEALQKRQNLNWKNNYSMLVTCL